MPANKAVDGSAGTDEADKRLLEADEELADDEEIPLPPGLTEEQIEEITTLLRGGRRLPPHLFPNLFEAPREYQLAYRGKSRAVDILAETMAVPLQPARSFGEPVNDWSNMLVLGDNLQVLRELLHLKENGQLRNADGSEGVRLCYIDPPFASQREFVGSRSERAYQDRVAGAEFVEHLRRRLILIRELLADNGSLFVHLDTRKSHYIKVVLDELFGEGNFRNEIVWKRTSGHSDAALLGSVHETILYYTKGSSPVWHQEFVPYEEWYVEQYYRYSDPDGRKFMSGDLGAAGLAGGGYDYVWNGVRRVWRVPETTMARLDAEGKVFYTKNGIPRIKRYLDESKGQPLADVWTDVLPVVSWSQERIGYPTQKPVQLIARVIEVASEPDDIVLDAFVGSGTTLVACEQFDEPRRWIGIDSGKFAIYASQARLLEQAGKKAPDRGFTLYNAGLYDYQTLRELPRSDFVDFVLEMFQCRKAATDIGGVIFDGYMGDNPVLVYDFEEHPEATIGGAFVEDLANICRGRLGDRCFIIAPASMVEPYEDYLTVGDTRFFFLRIPYSVIAELHKKAFSDLRQPTSEAMTNALIDSVGFDFIQPPRVECEYLALDGTLSIKITGFESEAFAVRPTAENIADLAMVLVDLSYDNEVFCLDSVFFADDLERDGWHLSFPRDSVSDRMMVVYIDLFGNEYREVKHPDEFVAAGPIQARKRGSGSKRSTRGAAGAARGPRQTAKKASVSKKAPAPESAAVRSIKATEKAAKSTSKKAAPTKPVKKAPTKAGVKKAPTKAGVKKAAAKAKKASRR